jgi:transcription elongation factor Elf1
MESNMDETTDSCPMCGGQPALLGTLGNLTWLRCINCGWEFTAKVKQLYVDIDALATPGDFIVSD